MKLVQFQWRPSDRQLRQFGMAAMLLLPLVGWWWGGRAEVAWAFAAAGLLLGALGWIQPRWLRPAFVGLSLATYPIGLVVSEATLLLVYFAVFVPLGLLLRPGRHDPLQRAFDGTASSYWQPKPRARGVESYYQQF